MPEETVILLMFGGFAVLLIILSVIDKLSDSVPANIVKARQAFEEALVEQGLKLAQLTPSPHDDEFFELVIDEGLKAALLHELKTAASASPQEWDDRFLQVIEDFFWIEDGDTVIVEK